MTDSLFFPLHRESHVSLCDDHSPRSTPQAPAASSPPAPSPPAPRPALPPSPELAVLGPSDKLLLPGFPFSFSPWALCSISEFPGPSFPHLPLAHCPLCARPVLALFLCLWAPSPRLWGPGLQPRLCAGLPWGSALAMETPGPRPPRCVSTSRGGAGNARVWKGTWATLLLESTAHSVQGEAVATSSVSLDCSLVVGLHQSVPTSPVLPGRCNLSPIISPVKKRECKQHGGQRLST